MNKSNTHGTPDATRDRDGDGMPDFWEAQTGAFQWSYQNQRYEFQRKFDWERDDRIEDTDADGLLNFAEYQNNTDPRERDTDGDRIPDGWEVQNNGKTVVRMDGVKQFATAATLRFAIASAAPTTVQLNPLDPADALLDPDEDGSTNLEEYLNGTSPERADTDGDGVSDGDEYANGANPSDASDAGQVDPTTLVDVPFKLYGDYAS